MDVVAPLVAHLQTPQTVQPRERPLHLPPMPTQALARFDAAACPASRAAASNRLAAPRVVVALVRMYLAGTVARTPHAPVAQWRHAVEHHPEHLRIVDVLCADDHAQWGTVAIYDDVALGALLATIRRIRSGPGPPLCAATEAASTEARFQSSLSAPARRSKSTRCRRTHTPASCQARSLRQQVMPEPQPISWGRYSHGMPVRSTNRMPVSVARSAMRGLLPRGLPGSGGSNGSIAV